MVMVRVRVMVMVRVMVRVKVDDLSLCVTIRHDAWPRHSERIPLSRRGCLALKTLIILIILIILDIVCQLDRLHGLISSIMQLLIDSLPIRLAVRVRM